MGSLVALKTRVVERFGGGVLVTKEILKAETAKQLAQRAKAQGMVGYSSLNKEELIKRLLQEAKKGARSGGSSSSASIRSPKNASPTGGTAKKSSAGSGKTAVAKSAAKTSKGAKKSAVAAVKTKTSSGASAAAGSASTGTAKKAAALKKAAPKSAGTVAPMSNKGKKPADKVKAKGGTKGSPLREVATMGKTSTGVKAADGASRTGGRKTKSTASKANSGPETHPAVVGQLKTLQQQRAAAKDLAFFREQLSASEEPKKDRVILFVRDPYWLQAYWEITKVGVERAKAALAEHWHMAEPTLRLLEAEEDGTTGSTEQVVREIPIHGGVKSWYIDVKDPPRSFRVVIGYLAPGNRFQAIAQSNLVHTPIPGSSDHVDHNWTDMAEIGDRVFSMSGGFGEGASTTLREVFEEKLRRPMNRSALSRYGAEGVIPGKQTGLEFAVDAELLIFGQTHPSAEVTISGEPVKIRDDGSFTVRMGLPDKRQVFPVSSTSFDGAFTYTTVLAIERNTKVMEPMSTEPGDEF